MRKFVLKTDDTLPPSVQRPLLAIRCRCGAVFEGREPHAILAAQHELVEYESGYTVEDPDGNDDSS